MVAENETYEGSPMTDKQKLYQEMHLRWIKSQICKSENFFVLQVMVNESFDALRVNLGIERK